MSNENTPTFTSILVELVGSLKENDFSEQIMSQVEEHILSSAW